MNMTNTDSYLVLIVDDSPETLGMLNSALEKERMTTLVALEGNQALNIAAKMHPDIILLDAIMPNIDGFEVCRKLKADPQLNGIPVIFMTGLSDTEHVVKGFESGGSDYVTKPINHLELIARIRVHIANTRLTLHIQSALDLAGQFVFAVNQEGKALWSTPQVNQLLESASGNSGWLNESLPKEIARWLACNPAMGIEFSANFPHKKLRMVFLGYTAENEYLLRVVDTETTNEISRLQQKLSLTAREAEVLLWIAKGKTNREIGQILGTSPKTINKHSEKIYKKLEVDNRTSAAAKALHYLEH